MSAMVESSVSPERCEMTAAYFASVAMRIAASVSVSVPIWFGLIRIAFAICLAMPSARILRVGDEHVVADELQLARRAAR